MTTAALTPARKRALARLLAAEARGYAFLRISNCTDAAHIYWQSADWMIRTGLADHVSHEYIQLTEAGRDIAKAAAAA